ncbi:MAG: Mor transcription activator family protein [Clostridia bacterium]|nr:Mor transcription activator family protein [Clostridia bacterium]
MRSIIMAIDKSNLKGEYLNGAYSELAAILGIDDVLKLHAKYRGTQIFFPVELFSRQFIINQIIDEYDGHNVRELATKYGYTEKWVRKILKDHIDSGD